LVSTDEYARAIHNRGNHRNGPALVLRLPVDPVRCRWDQEKIQVDLRNMPSKERTTQTTPTVKRCGNCLWGGLRAKPEGWGITIIKCELDHTGRRIEYVCEDWDPKKHG